MQDRNEMKARGNVGTVPEPDGRGRLRQERTAAKKKNRREPWNTRQSGILRIRDIVMP